MPSEKNQKPTEESATPARKKGSRGSPPVVAVHRRAASSEEATAIDQSLDRLLAELVRQARPPEEGENHVSVKHR